MKASTILCPICETENIDTDAVCVQCGASLEEKLTKLVSVPEHLEASSQKRMEDAASTIDLDLIPENGLGILVDGESKPYYVYFHRELILGRLADATLQATLNLSDLNAVNLGVSRRHAMIRRTKTGFEVLDLDSRNGTWLNGERLVPHRPYPLAGEVRLRLGQMWLHIKCRPFRKPGSS